MSLEWHLHRLRAMEVSELPLRVRKKLRERQDARPPSRWDQLDLTSANVFPALPDSTDAPAILRERLATHRTRILNGQWLAFGRVPIKVDDPPRWQRDYLANADLETSENAFALDYRKVSDGDSKLVWELSRWFELVRLAQVAYVLNDDIAAGKCAEWLRNWTERNPPFHGWNWVTALEAGIRLIQFAWIDALIDVKALRERILPPHIWHTWRHRSFGSSANNHLLGELAGLIIALTRWPGLEAVGPRLKQVQELWHREVLAQFAPDGGNREQALNYHLFSWEFCTQACRALDSAGRHVSLAVRDRLQRAEEFFLANQVPSEPWDYGDSDDGFVTPLFADSVHEWRKWLENPKSSPAITYWWGSPSTGTAEVLPEHEWRFFPDSGIARIHTGAWDLRWDLSPLGYKSIAAHGHLDALHLSIWWRGRALVIDPGTGAYFGDPALRTSLAGWEAHNGPRLDGYDYPTRIGMFLWSCHHRPPQWPTGELSLPAGTLRRSVTPEVRGWKIEDSSDGNRTIVVRWQFAPGAMVEPIGDGHWRLERDHARFEIQVQGGLGVVGQATVSPGFRQTAAAPYLELRATGGQACVLRTIFLAC